MALSKTCLQSLLFSRLPRPWHSDPRGPEARERFVFRAHRPVPEPREAAMGAPILPTGIEPEDVDASQFYVEANSLRALDDPVVEQAALLAQLASEVWTVNCGGLLVARQLATHHPEVLRPHLPSVIPALQKHMDALRSSLCKTALLCASDFFVAFGDELFKHLEDGTPSVLHVLLHKAALAKPFLMDEASRTLGVMIAKLDVDTLVEHFLLKRVGSKNDKVRATVAECLRVATDRRAIRTVMDENDDSSLSCIHTCRAELLKAAAVFVNDRQPGARENARVLLQTLKRSFREFENDHDGDDENTGGNLNDTATATTLAEKDPWTKHVEKTLGKSDGGKICKLC